MSADEIVQMKLLLPAGKIILLGCSGYSVFQAVRGASEPVAVVETLVVAFVGLTFYAELLNGLQAVSESLVGYLSKAGDAGSLKDFILSALANAADATTSSGDKTSFNIPAVVEQVFRLGVWGVMTSIVECVFLLADFIIQASQAVLWNLMTFLAPIACALLPLTSRIATGLATYAVELSLWKPLLILIQIFTSSAARKMAAVDGGWGLSVVAVELVAILLILSVPAIAHRFLSGAFAADFGAGEKLRDQGTRAVVWAKRKMSGGAM